MKDLRADAQGLVDSGNSGDLNEAIKILTEATTLAEPERARLEKEGFPQTDRETGSELAETFGVAGGAHRRAKDFDKALSFYERGAVLEERFALPSTYNRANAVKWSIRMAQRGIDELTTRIASMRTQLAADVDEVSGERRRDAWAWADLGDCHALLGDAPDALRAYGRFVQLAGVDDPKSSASVLREIAKVLPKDTRAARAVGSVIEFLDGAVK
jgi:tetratricopeptide (TPR) repeat protein